jgi:acyl-coenzyme A synthetase/AMP-(fatty) acid ligase
MANFKVPRTIKVVESLPLNPTGKVMKFELRARLAH